METKRYLVIEDFKTLCCDTIMRAGDILDIQIITPHNRPLSKNRLFIGNVTHGGLHKVKRSTFFRCCSPQQE